MSGFEGIYKIDAYGNVFSVDRYVKHSRGGFRKCKGQKLKPYLANNGYLVVSASKEGKDSPVLVHRKVLETYAGPCPRGMEACHKDGNRLHNHVSNLRWDTREENSKDKIKHGTMIRGEQSNLSKLSEQDVSIVRNLYEQGLSVNYIAHVYGMSKSGIRDVLSGKSWKWLDAKNS